MTKRAVMSAQHRTCIVLLDGDNRMVPHSFVLRALSDTPCARHPTLYVPAAVRQSVIDRADRPNPPPAVVEAKAVLAAQIEAARSKAPMPAPAAAEGATAEE